MELSPEHRFMISSWEGSSAVEYRTMRRPPLFTRLFRCPAVGPLCLRYRRAEMDYDFAPLVIIEQLRRYVN